MITRTRREIILSFHRNHMLDCVGNKAGRGPRVGFSGWDRFCGEREGSLGFGCWLGRLPRGAKRTGTCLGERGGLASNRAPSAIRFARCLSASLPSFSVTLFGKGKWFAARRKPEVLFFSHKYLQCSTLFPSPSLPVLLPPGSTDRCCSVARSLLSPLLLSFLRYLQSIPVSLTALRRFEASTWGVGSYCELLIPLTELTLPTSGNMPGARGCRRPRLVRTYAYRRIIFSFL